MSRIPAPGGSNRVTCGRGTTTSAPSQRVITCACGEAMASASVISPCVTSSSASESSLVNRAGSDSVASQ